MTVTLFQNARIVDPSRGMDERGSVLVKDGVIAGAGASAMNQGAPDGAAIIDCAGNLIVPGGSGRGDVACDDAGHRSGYRQRGAGRVRAPHSA
jgi:N-acetylglucosamine-6-phosphate deacetylase